ncbi:MAG: cytochrome c [Caldilineaceae bacterium]|nr:cytochrome c [Caldilineaceae bacterium]
MYRTSIFRLLPLLILAVALVLGGCGRDKAEEQAPAATQQANSAEANQAEEVAAGDPVKGKELFATTCAACHGPAGEGVQGLGKDMTTSTFIADQSDAELLAFIKVGRAPTDPLNTTGVLMPPKGGNPALTDEQLMDIIAYIREIHVD